MEGAAEGKGLGLQFLRHIERTKILAVLISADSPDIAAEYRTLLGELEKFEKGLLDKPRIVVITKMDIAAEDLEIPVLEDKVKVMPISSVSGHGLKELKDELWREVSGRTRAAEPLDESVG